MQNTKILTVTGTRHTHDLTDVQLENFQEHLQSLLLEGYTHVRHGDAVGADEHARHIALRMGYNIVIHPPFNARFRACCAGGVYMPNRSYTRRNQDMIDACQLLLALPNSNVELVRSGTWQTIRMARRAVVPRVIFYPNGQLVREGFNTLF